MDRGRLAHEAEKWEEAYVAYETANSMGELEAWDHHRFAESAFWTGRMDEAITLKEASYAKLLSAGERDAAAMTALDLAFYFKYRLAVAVSKAWVARAEKLLETEEATRGYGYLLRWNTTYALESEGDPEKAADLAEQVIQLGAELGDRSLEALGLMDKGRILVSMGRIDEGMALVDESMIAAVSGEIDADATGRNYCNMLSICDQIADYERAAEWSEAAEAWCTSHSDSAYPGICRITRAELKWLKGDWQDATADLRRAVDELTGFTPIIGAALYQIGEVQLRAGNLDGAEESFRSANEHAFPPLPGMAMLLLARGDADAGEQLLLDALISRPQPLVRARFLPALIDIECALGRFEEASTFIGELEQTAELCDSTAMRAQAADRRGVLALMTDDVDAAALSFQAAIKGWSGLRMPYESAQSRLHLGEAHRKRGNDAGAAMETEAATATLARLALARD